MAHETGSPTDPTRPLKHKRSFSRRLSETWNKVFRRSPTPLLQQPSQSGSARSASPSPSRDHRTSLTPGVGSAPAPTHQVTVAPQGSVRGSLQEPGANLLGARDEPPTIVISATATNSSGTSQHLANLVTSVRPVLPAVQPAMSGLWAGLGTALRALHKSARLFPPLQSAVGTFIPCLDVLEEASRKHKEYEELASELTSLVELLAQHLKRSNTARMSGSIANVARSIEEQAKLIENKRGRGTRRRLMEVNQDAEELDKYCRRIQALFRQLEADANLSIWSTVNDQMANTQLEGLMPVKLANYDSKLSTGIARGTCTANTRTTILSELNNWSRDSDAPDLYWMNGMAGTGKTTIACSFSESLEERKQLAASFFCTRTVPDCREVSRIIPTIAYQLARYSIPFQSVLCETLSEDPDAGSKNIMKQFERLLKKPLLRVKEAIPNDLVVVIDALDECDDMREVELLLSILLKSVADMPLRFFVTSRPEPEIYGRMLTRTHDSRATLHLHEVEKSLVQADIEVYLEAELGAMSPTPGQIKELARRSGNLFIYAATLVRYIRSRKSQVDPQRRLQAMLDMTSEPTKQHATIDGLYAAVLKAVLDDDSEDLEAQEIDDVRRVLQTAICVQEPVSVEVLAALAGIDSERRVLSALRPLRSVLHFSDATGLVSTLHASFPDFMFDETRSKAFSCNLAEYSQVLAQRCFEVMKAQLRFNICGLESSFIPDNTVDNLEERVKQAISPTLWYACRHWGDHLRHAVYSDSLCTMLSDFLSVRLLFWMEALNLKREINAGPEVLLKVLLWLKSGTVPPGVAKLTEDVRNFMTSFAANPISRCTPHIYLSLLPFCSKSSSVFKQYWEKTCGLINVTGSAMQRRDAAALASWTAVSEVLSVAYSPDGNSLAVGCRDGTLTVRRAHDGTPIAGPFEGHTDSVWSVAFSPDGTHVVSGSSDCTVRVWNTQGGTLVAGPFKGHTGSVRSVAYSPDGTHVVSGSDDHTIRVWTVQDGASIADPFKGHTNSVCSVAYSPDGIHIVSGSDDHTIRVWSAQNGTLVAGPLKGHTNSVYSVAYSPDGARIVSGSRDNTIRVWSAYDGKLVVAPFEGHTDSVYSAIFSPDGIHIVSGSSDHTIRVWGAHDGTLVLGPFEGHTDSIWSVAYSPDGTRILSGSSDRTIRVWGVHDGTLAAGPLEGRTNSVLSVTYSPDGTHLISASRDHTIRAWGVQDGTLVAGPFKGHTDSVYSVAYSPDRTRVALGSFDHTIRIWDVHDGTLVAGPFKEHTGWLLSMAYSPDGSHIVSGSDDRAIRVWSAHNGTLVAGPFNGHTDLVLSVAYSPDGSRIISGSDDRTVRVWGVDGNSVVGPLEGHTDSVLSVMYSPDGTRIVSGSRDHTIRVWDAHSGTLVTGPFQGHTNAVYSVAYSPDGAYIVSGSSDRTIRVWNVQDGTLAAGPLEGHTNSVYSVAYSPDGTRIVSGSRDGTIRAWNMPVGSPVGGTDLPNSSRNSPAIQAPTTAHQDVSLDHCTVGHDGWVTNAKNQLLFWVPSEIARIGTLPTTNNPLIIDSRGSLHIDYSGVFLGERWDKCYKSE